MKWATDTDKLIGCSFFVFSHAHHSVRAAFLVAGSDGVGVLFSRRQPRIAELDEALDATYRNSWNLPCQKSHCVSQIFQFVWSILKYN